MVSLPRLDEDAQASLERFSSDAGTLARASGQWPLSVLLVAAYARALDAACGARAGDAWSEFYVLLEAFVRASLRSLELPCEPPVCVALARFRSILDDDLGRALFGPLPRLPRGLFGRLYEPKRRWRREKSASASFSIVPSNAGQGTWVDHNSLYAIW